VRFRSGVRAISRRKRLTGAHAARPSDRQGLKVAAAIAAPLVVAIALIALVAANHGGGNSSPASSSSTTTATATKAAKAFQTKADDAFKPLGDAVKVFLPKANDFEAGKVTPADFKGAVDAALPEFVKARDAVAKLEKYKPDPAINKYFVDAADFYVETARIYGVAADPAADALRAGLNIAARRVRTLGARIYDRGRVVLDPTFYGASSQDVELRPPTEVPDWRAEGMAAGPPLADPPGPPAASPPVRETTCGAGVPPPCRQEESKSKWVSGVKKLAFPEPLDVARAVDELNATTLGQLAGAFETKTRALRGEPDPKKDREWGAVVGLGLLSDGEAARTAQFAALLPAGDARTRLQMVARRALVVGDDLLQIRSGLGFKISGQPRSLLNDTGP
jgi:hypothetical protein